MAGFSFPGCWEPFLAATGLILPAVGAWWGSVGAQSQLDPSDRGWLCWDGTTSASPPALGSSTARRGLLWAPPDIIWQDLVGKEANQVNVLALPGLLGHTRVQAWSSALTHRVLVSFPHFPCPRRACAQCGPAFTSQARGCAAACHCVLLGLLLELWLSLEMISFPL